MKNEQSFYDLQNQFLLTKRKNFLIRLLTIIVLWAILITYFFLPFSKVNNIKIKGNVFLSKSQILEMSDIDSKQFKIDVNNKKVEKKLNSYYCIEKTTSKISLFSSSLTIKEIYPIGKNENRTLWSNGFFTTEKLDEKTYGKIPEIKTTINASFIEDFAMLNTKWGELIKTNKMTSIEEINYELTDKNTYSFTFLENILDKDITIIIVIDKNSIAKKLNLGIYEQIVLEIKENPDYIESDKVLIGYTEKNYSYWRI